MNFAVLNNVGKVYRLSRDPEPRVDQFKRRENAGSRISSANLEPGIEIALNWLEQAEKHSDCKLAFDAIVGSVLHMLNTELIFALDARGKNASVLFANMGFPAENLLQSAEDDRFCTWLAHIRFAYVFNRGSTELRAWFLQTPPPFEDLLAVPLFYAGVPGGCLAAANRLDNRPFDQGEVMLLSLAAAVITIGQS